MKREVISLGGSLIVPDRVATSFLQDFCALLRQFHDRRFIIVVGGGSTARKYMDALEGSSIKTRAEIGIMVTRLHAWFLARLFGEGASQTIPRTMKQVSNLLLKNKVAFVGALRFKQHQTSDGTAAQLANFLRTRFVNVTNVNGLYTKDPRKFGDAKLVPSITAEDFRKITCKMKFEPGQHFVLDQHAAEIIHRHRIPTYIVGNDLKNLEHLLKGKDFIGTSIA